MVPVVSRKCESPHAAVKRAQKAMTISMPPLINILLKKRELLKLCEDENFVRFAERMWSTKRLFARVLKFALTSDDKARACMMSAKDAAKRIYLFGTAALYREPKVERASLVAFDAATRLARVAAIAQNVPAEQLVVGFLKSKMGQQGLVFSVPTALFKSMHDLSAKAGEDCSIDDVLAKLVLIAEWQVGMESVWGSSVIGHTLVAPLPSLSRTTQVDNSSDFTHFVVVNARPETRKHLLAAHVHRQRSTVVVQVMVVEGMARQPIQLALRKSQHLPLEVSLLPLCNADALAQVFAWSQGDGRCRLMLPESAVAAVESQVAIGREVIAPPAEEGPPPSMHLMCVCVCCASVCFVGTLRSACPEARRTTPAVRSCLLTATGARARWRRRWCRPCRIAGRSLRSTCSPRTRSSTTPPSRPCASSAM